jgi:hypothetical protein
MKNKLLYGILLGLLLITACNPDHVDEVEFDVHVKNEAINCRVGEPVNFLFEGNAEYITFYSGEPGNCYANTLRTQVEMASLELECTIKQQYTDKEYRNKELIHVYVAEDFNGTYTWEDLQKANFTSISGVEEHMNQIVVPIAKEKTSEEISSKIDLSAFKDKPFHIAFQYIAPKRVEVPNSDGNNRYVMQPRVDITPLSLIKQTVEERTEIWDNPKTDWAFRIVYQNSKEQGNYKVDDTSLLFQPQKGKEHTDDDVIVWMVSRKIDPTEIEPDRGIAIKSIDAYLPSYTHTYSKPGQYTATFIATNANLWDSEQKVKELTINVSE